MNESSLAKKLRRRTAILTDQEVAFMVSAIPRSMGAPYDGLFHRSGSLLEDGIRWGPLGARCQREREKLGLSLKEAAGALKVPKYRLQAVERCSLSSFLPAVANKYFRFLKVEAHAKRWAKA